MTVAGKEKKPDPKREALERILDSGGLRNADKYMAYPDGTGPEKPMPDQRLNDFGNETQGNKLYTNYNLTPENKEEHPLIRKDLHDLAREQSTSDVSPESNARYKNIYKGFSRPGESEIPDDLVKFSKPGKGQIHGLDVEGGKRSREEVLSAEKALEDKRKKKENRKKMEEEEGGKSN